MVEELEDIANINFDEIQASDKPASPEPVKEETKPVEAKPQSTGAASAVGTDEFYDELEHMLHSGTIRVAPAAGAWMRAYMILPTEVKATGPKGYIIKTDVLEHIEANKLVKGKRQAPSAQPAPAKKPASAPSKAAATPSPVADPNDPFK